MIGKGMVLLSIGAALFLCCCQWNVYELELKPNGKSLERKLVCYRTQEGGFQISSDGGPKKDVLSKFPEKELARIAEVYGVTPPPGGAKKFTFEGTYSKKTPGDIGGAGFYSYFDSPLGSITGYAERFRGNDDLAMQLQASLKATDRLIDIMDGWLETRIGQEAWWIALHQFIDTEFRQDLKNLFLHLWLLGNAKPELLTPSDEERRQKDVVARIALYLLERDYIVLDEIPELTRLASSFTTEKMVKNTSLNKDQRATFLFLRRMLTRKLGIDENNEFFDSLGDLIASSESEEIEKSLDDYVRTTPEYKRMLRDWENKKGADPDAEEPKPQDVFTELMERMSPILLPLMAFFGGPFGNDVDEISITWTCEEPPIVTNGEWKAEEKKVVWSGRIFKEQNPPAIAFACWSVPNEAAQKKAFDKILLTEGPLAAYVLWYNGLAQEESKEWDAFLGSLKPDDDINKKVGSFLFEAERTARDGLPIESQESRVNFARKLFLEALQKE